jgi:hypothetical protein
VRIRGVMVGKGGGVVLRGLCVEGNWRDRDGD